MNKIHKAFIKMIIIGSVVLFGCDSDSFSTDHIDQAPRAAMSVSSLPLATPNSEITFQDISTNTPTSWYWDMPGAEPNTSTEQNPTVIYPEEGVFDVTLIVSNAFGSSEIIIEDYITIAKPDISDSMLIALDFENELKNSGTLGDTGDFSIHPDIAAPSSETYVSGHTGNAYAFDQSNYLMSSWTGITGGAPRTFAAWIYIPNDAVGNNNTIIGTGIKGRGQKYVFTVNPAGQLRAEIEGNGFNGPEIIPETWTHVAVTHSGSLNITGTKLYINGVEVAIGTNTTVNINTELANVTLGAAPGASSETALSKGYVDELRIYNIELTPAQINDVMNGD